MTAPWIAGIQIRGLDRDDTPVADFLCGRCDAHKRVTGRAEVTKFLKTDPAADHATRCKPRGVAPPAT